MKFTVKQETIFELLFVTIICGTIFQCSPSYAVEVKPSFELLGGLIDDQALIQSSGRELQPFKMVRVIAGVDVAIDEQWSAKFESVLIGDDLEPNTSDSINTDYYKGYGADLLYYGDYPVRNLYVQNKNFKIGRMVNFHGLTNYQDWFLHRHDAPHALYFDREILNGVSYNYGILSVAVLSGDGRQDRDYNFYLEGKTDINQKSNNTPILEVQIDYKGFYAGYHQNKIGSAPGVIFNGKYNDNRTAVGFQKEFEDFKFVTQFSQYKMGLTESGDQGQYPDAKDIYKNGYFITANYKGFQYTYERLDRLDSKVYYTYGAATSQEVSNIYSYNWKFVQIFYRTIQNDFPELSNMQAEDQSYKFGVLTSWKF